MNDSIITVDYNMVTDTSLDKRHGSHGRVESVKVYDITNDSYIDWNANEPKYLPRTHHNRAVVFMTWFLIGVGGLGFISWTVEMVSPSPSYQSIERQRGT